MDALVGDKLALYETSGSLHGGRRVWMLARIPKEYWAGADDLIKPSSGPAHLLAVDHPNTLIGTFPTVMISAFAVPFSTLLHVLSLRQLKRVPAPVGFGV